MRPGGHPPYTTHTRQCVQVNRRAQRGSSRSEQSNWLGARGRAFIRRCVREGGGQEMAEGERPARASISGRWPRRWRRARRWRPRQTCRPRCAASCRPTPRRAPWWPPCCCSRRRLPPRPRARATPCGAGRRRSAQPPPPRRRRPPPPPPCPPRKRPARASRGERGCEREQCAPGPRVRPAAVRPTRQARCCQARTFILAMLALDVDVWSTMGKG